MSRGVLFALLAGACAGVVPIFGKIGVAGVSSSVATAIRSLVMFVVLAAVVAARGELQSAGRLSPRGLAGLVLSGLAGAASWWFYFRALQLAPVVQVAPLDRLSVVFSIALAFLFLGERVSLNVLAGVALMVAGAVLVVRG